MSILLYVKVCKMQIMCKIAYLYTAILCVSAKTHVGCRAAYI